MKYFEDFEVGAAVAIPAEYVLSEEEIVEVASRWDPQPFHIDAGAAARSVFGGLVACSAHIFGIYSWLGNRMTERVAAIAAVGFDELRLPSPARPGDRLRATARCIGKRVSESKPDRGIVESLLTIENQRGETVFSIKSTVLIARRAGA